MVSSLGIFLGTRLGTLVEEDGCDGGGGTMGGEQVHYNRDLLKGNHSRGARAPSSATYEVQSVLDSDQSSA